MTQVLVTGAAGFIGSHLCESLLRRGYTVRGLDAFTEFYDPASKRRNIETLDDPARTSSCMVGDLLTAPLDEALDGVDLVAHLAGEPGVSGLVGPELRAVRRSQRPRRPSACSRPRPAAASTGWSTRPARRCTAPAPTRCGPPVSRGRPAPTASPSSPPRHSSAPTPAPGCPRCRSATSPSTARASVPTWRRTASSSHCSTDGRSRSTATASRSATSPTSTTSSRPPCRRCSPTSRPVPCSTSPAAGPTSVNDARHPPRGARRLRSPPSTPTGERPGDVPRTEGDIGSARDQLGWKPTVDLLTGLRTPARLAPQPPRGRMPSRPGARHDIRRVRAC